MICVGSQTARHHLSLVVAACANDVGRLLQDLVGRIEFAAYQHSPGKIAQDK